MASFQEAYAAVDLVFDVVSKQAHVRPQSAGVIKADAGFGLKVVLPYQPDDSLPNDVSGVPIEYHVAETEPVLLGGAAPAWLVESRKRRSGG